MPSVRKEPPCKMMAYSRPSFFIYHIIPQLHFLEGRLDTNRLRTLIAASPPTREQATVVLSKQPNMMEPTINARIRSIVPYCARGICSASTLFMASSRADSALSNAVAVSIYCFKVFSFKDFSEMILAAITVTILFELPIERALASETLLLISKPGHVRNVFIIEFIARHLPRSRQARSSINRSSAYQAERTEITKSKGHCRKPPNNDPSLSSPHLESTATVSLQA